MLKLLIGPDWTANRQAVLSRIARDVRERKPGRILMVPELISHETERLLCREAGDTASRYAEVLSFTRLARRASERAGSGAMECLDNGGRVVAMAAAARQLTSRLKAYAAVETKPEFLLELVNAVDEFKRCCISPEDLKKASLETEGSLSQKLEELALLMEGYDALCSRGRRDPRDQMAWLLEQLEQGDYAREHVFYIDGFPDFTRQHMAILEHLIGESPQVTVSLNCDSVGSHQLAFEKAGQTASELYRVAQRLGIPVRAELIPERQDGLHLLRARLYQGPIPTGEAKSFLRVFRADSAWAEVMTAAHTVRELVSSGSRYRDITLVCTDMGQYQPLVNLIFPRLHIPIYQSGTEDILQKSMIATVLTALDAALSDFDQRSVFRYLRSALSGMDPDTCDLVENYAVLWGIRGSRWTQEWENHPDGLGEEWTEDARQRLQMLNDQRSRFIAPLERLRQGLRDAASLSQKVLALYAFLENVGMERRLELLARELEGSGEGRDAQILNQLWEILLSALEQLYDVLGDTHWEPEHFARLLRLLLSQYDVGTIPPVLDVVQLGPVSAMRCHSGRHLILLGAQEGSLPGYSGSTGVLTDQERVALRELGVPLTGGAMEGVQAEFAEIYGVFCGAMESVQLSCSGKQPSFIYRRLAQLAGGEAQPEDPLGFADADAQEAGAFLAGWKQEKTAAQLGVQEEYLRTLARANYALGKVSDVNIRKLYGDSLSLSASQIDKQAECRLSYFLNYGLRARERKEAAVDPAEFGTYVHAVLENTARCIRDLGGFHQVSLEETLNIAHRYSEEYARERFGQLQSERMEYLFRRNLRELDMVVQELWEELRESGFEPADFEVAFGASEEGSLPPIAIPNGKINAILRGFVDRVDIWQSPGSRFYRVVDYKTGKKDFDYCDVFNGVGLQMLLYLFALRSSGGEILGANPIPAGVQYFPARVPYLLTDGVPEPEELERERRRLWKRQGLLLNDEAVLRAMEPGEEPKRLPVKNKKGELTGDLADREQMKLLEGYVFRVLGKLVEDIASGNVEPNPYTRGNAHDACRFCPYGSICHSGSVAGRRNYKAMDAQRFWEEVGKEMEKHG
ncbi:MAG: PD-(D/E)XK nuclease family protein [Faecousia sp.]